MKKLIDNNDCVIIGAGSGLSSAAGFEYSGETFFNNFPDIYEKYGISDMYSASFIRFGSDEEKWKFWSKFIYLERYKDGPKPLYKRLFNLVKDRDYFVITTNVDHQFHLSGFDEDRLFCTQGDYGLFQCSIPCHNKTYDNESVIMAMLSNSQNDLPLSPLAPKCPVCGREMTVNLRVDDTFCEDDNWKLSSRRYDDFLMSNKDKKILFLELGVGMNTPSIIKYPFLKMCAKYPKAFYVCINMAPSAIPIQLKKKSLIISGDISDLI